MRFSLVLTQIKCNTECSIYLIFVIKCTYAFKFRNAVNFILNQGIPLHALRVKPALALDLALQPPVKINVAIFPMLSVKVNLVHRNLPKLVRNSHLFFVLYTAP